jgi:hypothetical protein
MASPNPDYLLAPSSSSLLSSAAHSLTMGEGGGRLSTRQVFDTTWTMVLPLQLEVYRRHSGYADTDGSNGRTA